MASQDVALALLAIEDDEVCREVSGGNLAAAGDLRLSADETELVRGAAAEQAEGDVAGLRSASAESSPTIRAAIYASQGPLPQVQEVFEGYLGRTFGGNIRVIEDQNWAYA